MSAHNPTDWPITDGHVWLLPFGHDGKCVLVTQRGGFAGPMHRCCIVSEQDAQAMRKAEDARKLYKPCVEAAASLTGPLAKYVRHELDLIEYNLHAPLDADTAWRLGRIAKALGVAE